MADYLTAIKERYEAGLDPTREDVRLLIKDIEEHRAAMSVVLKACGDAMIQTSPDMLETIAMINPSDLVLKIAEAAGVQ